MSSVLRCIRLAVLVLALLPMQAAAEPATRPATMDRINAWMHERNGEGRAWLSATARRFGLSANDAEALAPLKRVALNLVQEPISVVSGLIAGDLSTAWHHARRFTINTTVGLGGVIDRAAERGLAPGMADLGLALCRRGVPPGPFVVVPVLGPRTLRDAVADLVIGNVIAIALLAPIAAPLLGLEALAVLVVVDEILVLTLARSMDPTAQALEELDYDDMRTAYLANRAERCASERREIS